MPRAADHAADVRRRLERFAEGRSVRATRGTYVEAQAEVRRQVDRAILGRSSMVGDVRGADALKRTARAAQVEVAQRMATALDAVLAEARADSLSSAQRFVRRMEGAPTALEARPTERHLLATHGVAPHRTHLATWALDQRAVVDEAVAEGLRRQEPLGAIQRRVELALEAQWHRVERIVRTEAAAAYNTVQEGAVRELSRVHPDVMKRWTERVDDASWTPLDNRVAADSMALHGQLAPPGGAFTMPADEGVSSKVWGKAWTHPPNRPNDRAVVTPWRAAWGIPGWVLEGGHKRWLLRRS